MRAGILAAGIGFGALVLAASASFHTPASAEARWVNAPIATRLTIPPLPPTVPCKFCGPSGLTDSGVVAWAYPLHFCPPANAPNAVFAIIYGWGHATTGPATFFGEIQGHIRQLDTLQPGDETAEYPAIEVPPGTTFLLHVWATTNSKVDGPRVTFGNGTTERNLTLVCECPTLQTAPVTTPPNNSSTTVAGSTIVQNSSTIPVQATTIPHKNDILPVTGIPWLIPAVVIAIVALYFGLLAWVHSTPMEDD